MVAHAHKGITSPVSVALLGSALTLAAACLHASDADDGVKPTTAELRARIAESYTPEMLRGVARELATRDSKDAVAALEEILVQCDAFSRGERGRVSEGTVEATRAYAFYALGVLARTQPVARQVIEQRFNVSRPVGLALLKARYAQLPSLVQRRIATMFGLGSEDDKGAGPRALRGVEFVRISFGDSYNEPSMSKIAALRDAAVILEWSRMRSALPVLLKLLSQAGDQYWRKRVYRAIMNLKVADSTRLGVLREQLRDVRGDERDTCRWELDRPESIRFAIDTVSAEAFLVLAIWRLDISLRSKAGLSVASLESPSFTARAAAIDRLASTPPSTAALQRALEHKDEDTRHFMAVRLGYETNAVARELLTRLAQDESSRVGNAARNALGGR